MLPFSPNETPCVAEGDKEQLLVKDLKGICLVGVENALHSPCTSDVQFFDLDIPKNAASLESSLRSYLGRPLYMADLIEIKHKIILHYRNAHRPLVTVYVPEQDITEGVVRLVVTESKLDELNVRGERYFSKEFYKRSVKMEKGKPINERSLINDLNYLNRNPFRKADLVYSPGNNPHTTNVDLVVKEQFPLNVYAGVDNTGLQHIDRTRLFGGFTWGKFFGWDQILTVQWSSAPDPHKFYAVTGNYIIPLPIQHVLNFYGGYSQVHAHVPFSSKTHGESEQASFRYTIPLSTFSEVLHEIMWGYDFKRTNNSIEFVEQFPRIGQVSNLTQFMVGYNLGYQHCQHKVGFDVQLYFSPFTWLPDQSKEDYHSLNPFADPIYVYGHSSINYKVNLPKHFYWTLLVYGQLSNKSLLPSEQIGLGGYNTVRGYEERQLNTDDGLLVRTEFFTPKMGLFSNWKKCKYTDELEFLVFLDYGLGVDRHRLPGEKKSDYILSAGPGVRYSVAHNLFARLDWGVKLHRDHFPGGWSMVHFSVTASY